MAACQAVKSAIRPRDRARSALQQLAVWDLRSYATIQTVWGETESYQLQRTIQAQWASQPARTTQNGSGRINSGLRRATNIVTVVHYLNSDSLRNLNNIFLINRVINKQEIIQKYRSVTKNMILEVCKDIFKINKCSLVYLSHKKIF